MSLLAVIVALGAAAPAAAQGGTVFVVNSTGDGADSQPGDGVCATGGGSCTLRAAIQEANALGGTETIQFSIGSGIATISVGSGLPTISTPMTIDGTTQPGFSGTPIVVVNASGTKSNVNGLTITGGGTTVRGLVITNFPGNGIQVSGGAGNVFETNYVGIGADGQTAAGNGDCGIRIDGSTGNRIGGTTIAQRNVISSNTGKGAGGGIFLVNGGSHVIQGNFIGVDATGMLIRTNEGRGIAMSGSHNNVVGGPGAGAGNLISGNRATGVRMIGSNNALIQGNIIGVNKTITEIIANDRGVQIRGSNNTQVLGNFIAGNRYDGILVWSGSSNNLMQGNTIAFNGYSGTDGNPEGGASGIWVADSTGNKIVSNSIYGQLGVGIALDMSWAPWANDTGDGDTGANNLQNYPVVASATVSGSSTILSGSLNSASNTAFLVQFFADSQCDASGNGEGHYFVGQTTVTTNGSGNASFTVPIAGAIPRGWIVSSTATDPSGNTSGFSACTVVR